jgi:hypothetical protein
MNTELVNHIVDLIIDDQRFDNESHKYAEDQMKRYSDLTEEQQEALFYTFKSEFQMNVISHVLTKFVHID